VTTSGLLLAGDVGGTKTNLALFAVKDGVLAPVLQAHFVNAGYPDLEAVVREFVARAPSPPVAASFGVA